MSTMPAAVSEDHGLELHQAMLTRTTVPPLRHRLPGMTLTDAYAFQLSMVRHRLQSGETIIGKKVGVTSKPVQDYLGVFEPDFGQLTSDMLRSEAQGVDLSGLIQPKAEAELAVVLERDLQGPGLTATDILRATAYVSPCFEIVDSPIDAWDIRIQDTVADNASCGVFILGEAKGNPRSFDMALAGMVLEKNGALFSTSAGAAVQGSPSTLLSGWPTPWARSACTSSAGEVILSGSQSALVPVTDRDKLVCTIGGLGSCRARFFSGADA
jgi:2-oxopent-4-enoate/cis-2-oxohex-4-enoate hydratase